MKRLSLILSLVITIPCLAQEPDPDLFQTWYLQDIFLEFGPPLHLIEPPIYASLEISENLDYSGEAACNTFTGTYMYDPVEDTLHSIEFSHTNTDCVFHYHNKFETQYFATINSNWSYEITDDGVGLQLRTHNLFGLSATYTNYTLSTPDIKKVDITVYPNPVNDLLTIVSPNNEIHSISMHTIDGKKINSFEKIYQSGNEISLANLKSGVYFLELRTDLGRVTKTVIKK